MEAGLTPIMRSLIPLYQNAIVFLFFAVSWYCNVEISYNMIYTKKQSCFTQGYSYCHLYYILLNFFQNIFVILHMSTQYMRASISHILTSICCSLFLLILCIWNDTLLLCIFLLNLLINQVNFIFAYFCQIFFIGC